MNRLICEACGSNNIIKSNGLFVCESCGCKYTIDEVKDIVMNVNINVQTDDSDKLERYLELAKETYVKKTLTIPTWLDVLAKAKNINFSSVLVEGLKKELNISMK